MGKPTETVVLDWLGKHGIADKVKCRDISELTSSLNKEREIKVGPYLIRKHPPYPDGRQNILWLSREDGEGMGADLDELWKTF